MCKGILARLCPKTQGTVTEIMAREMGKVTWWAAIFEDTRSSLWAYYRESFHGFAKKMYGHVDECITSV